jgi:hypothetical protein
MSDDDPKRDRSGSDQPRREPPPARERGPLREEKERRGGYDPDTVDKIRREPERPTKKKADD